MQSNIINPIFNSNYAAIVISFSDNYSLSGAVLLYSIIKNSKSSINYDIVILEDKISEKNKLRLNDIIKNHKNFSLRFFDANTLFESKKIFTRYYFSPIVYARLFIPDLFKNYKKVIYIDSDMVVTTDVSELLNIDLGDKCIAAVKDIVMHGFVQFKVKSAPESGAMDAETYIHKILNMDDSKKYFQAGLIIFDIPKILALNKNSSLTQNIESFPFWFLDQDILNKVFYNYVFFLPLNWNVYHGNSDVKTFYSKLESNIYTDYLNARNNPKIIHFAGDQKPWINPKVDFYNEFYKNIAGTSWENDLQNSIKNVQLLKKIKGKLTPFVNVILPIGSNQRTILRNAYYKLNSFFSQK